MRKQHEEQVRILEERLAELAFEKEQAKKLAEKKVAPPKEIFPPINPGISSEHVSPNPTQRKTGRLNNLNDSLAPTNKKPEAKSTSPFKKTQPPTDQDEPYPLRSYQGPGHTSFRPTRPGNEKYEV